jgi:hypothetical protein
MAAASAFLLADDTSRAVAVLHRFRHGSDAAASKSAAAMLKELEEIEPSAKAAPGLDEEFFRDRGVAEPARITPLVPKVDQRRMEILMRPLPRMVLDADPVTLLEALSANRAADQLPPQLPSLPAARVSDERPWAEAQRMISDARAAKSAVPEPEQAARMSAAVGSGKTLRTVAIDTTPPGASIFLNEMTESVCTSPCDLKVRPGTYALTATLAGFESLTEEIRVGTAPVPLTLSFNPIRGKVFIDAPDSALLEINGRPLQVRAPVEIEVVPGLYRFAARSGDRGREQFVNVRPDARLRLPLAP